MNHPVRTFKHKLVPASEVKPRAGILTVFSSQSRHGEWTVPRELRVLSLFGNAELDLREARLPEGETRIHILAILGSVELLLPPGVRVEVEVDGLASSLEIKPDPVIEPEPDAPVILITGSAYLASVSGETRFARESEREARKRLKSARR